MDSRWTILRRLGEGASGYVYLVRKGERVSSLKRVLKTSCVESREMLIGERLHHPCILSPSAVTLTQSSIPLQSTFHGGCVRAPLFINFEMKPFDTSLATLIKLNPGGLPLPLVKDVAFQVLQALSYAHTRGIAHRDVKPDNILLSIKNHHVVLADWGSASSITSQPRAAPGYAPPEQLLGLRAEAAPGDVWGLGVSLCEALLGRKFIPQRSVESPLETLLWMARKCGGLTPSILCGAEGELGGMSEVVLSMLDESLEAPSNEGPLRNVLARHGRFGVLVCNLMRLSHRARPSAVDALLDECFEGERVKWRGFLC